MLVTEVQMLLHHEDVTAMAKMLDWLTHNAKFLFDKDQRVSYGLWPVNVVNNADWVQADVRVDQRCRTGPFIDLQFTLREYIYPHLLARILRGGGWKIKGRWREQQVAAGTA